MSVESVLSQVCVGVLLGGMLAGCSTWRCRGFIDAREMPNVAFKHNYVLDSLEFRHLADNLEVRKASPLLALLSEQDALVETSYLSDISRELGMTNVVPGAVRIRLSVVPVSEVHEGRNTLAWPMCCTFGVFPAHLVDEVPFDAIVEFISKDESGKDFSYSTASVGLVRTDYQCGLSRLDMDAPPPCVSAVGENRDDGTIGTGRGLRSERFREVFVKTLSAVVKRAIASREGLACEQVPQSSTEFGPVVFPTIDMVEREQTPGWGVKPEGEPPPPPENFDQFRDQSWNRPKSPGQVRLRKLVDSGFISKDQWEVQIKGLWTTRNGGK